MPMTTMDFASIADKGSTLQHGEGSPKQPLPHTVCKLFPVSPTQLLTPLWPGTHQQPLSSQCFSLIFHHSD